MTEPLRRYLAPKSFGPESFAAAILGFLCIALPFVGWVPNDTVWCLFAPGVAGAALVFFPGNGRRIGIGLLAAFLGFFLIALAFLAGLAVGHLF